MSVNRNPYLYPIKLEMDMAFTLWNTENYTHDERRALNAEWDQIVDAEYLEPGTDEYEYRADAFQHEVSRRN